MARVKKLEYMDTLMNSLVGVKPIVTAKEQIDPVRSLKKTLREHYRSKRERYGLIIRIFMIGTYGDYFREIHRFSRIPRRPISFGSFARKSDGRWPNGRGISIHH